jgi:hypothetical protein
MVTSLLPEGCGLCIHVKSMQGFDSKDGEGAADLFITVNAAAQKHQTRTVKKGQPLEWRDVCIFGEDILLQGGRSINFEVRSWTLTERLRPLHAHPGLAMSEPATCLRPALVGQKWFCVATHNSPSIEEDIGDRQQAPTRGRRPTALPGV